MPLRSVFLAALVACGAPATEPTAPAAPAAPAEALMPPHGQAPPHGQPPHGQNAAAAPADAVGGYTGKAVEVLEGGGYTYVRMQIADSELWIAGPLTAVKIGDTVTAPKGSAMANFHSNTLDRTFPSIDFVARIQVGGSQAPVAAGAVPGPAPASQGTVAKLAGGMTVGEVWAGQKSLVGKEVSLRARVVKYTPNILDTNFVHIQDGTGDPTAKTNDLTVTTKTELMVGQVVVLRGTLIADKDFGFGYNYPLIVEDAIVSADHGN